MGVSLRGVSLCVSLFLPSFNSPIFVQYVIQGCRIDLCYLENGERKLYIYY